MSTDPGAPPPAPAELAPAAEVTGAHAQVRRERLRLSLVWLVPIVAALVAISMLVKTWRSIGPNVSIQFQTAAGLVAGKTPVKYKDVVIGTVKSIELARDRTHIVAVVALTKGAREFAREDARYWVVRPRIGSSGVSGIDTILSGAYIAADIGRSEQAREDFIGLEKPPTVVTGRTGKGFELDAQDLGSLDVGSPVYFRRLQVGEVVDYTLTGDGKGVHVQIFVDAPYDQYVQLGSRFWNASGLDFSLGADGFRMDAQSLATVLIGGIAFTTPFTADARPAPDGQRFTLEKDREAAIAPADGQGQYVQMRFDQTLRGMTTNSDVELMGLKFGRVVSVTLDHEARGFEFPVIVGAMVYPQRFARLRDKLVPAGTGEAERNGAFIRALVERGVRARARSGNLLTGQLVVALDVMPKVAKLTLDPTRQPLTIPTMAGGFDQLEEQLGSIVAKLDRVPFDAIGRKLDANLNELQGSLERVRGKILPGTENTVTEAQRTFVEARRALDELRQAAQAARSGALDEDSRMQQQLAQTLLEVQRAAQSLRGLTELLDRHPESLLRGRPDDAAPAPTPAPATAPQERRP